MAEPSRPFTPETLAERWLCSAETVRQLVNQGRLRAFRVGRMIRIPLVAVEEYENCENTGSGGSMAALSSHGQIPAPANDGAIVLMHSRPRRPRQKRST